MPGEPRKTAEERADMTQLSKLIDAMPHLHQRIYSRAVDIVLGDWPAHRNRWPEKIDLARRVHMLTRAELRTLRDALFGSGWQDGETVTRRLLG